MNTQHFYNRQQGFNLIELMVSMALGLFLLMGVMTLYENVSSNNRELAKTNILIENGRFAIQLLADDVAHAGFWGGYVPDYDNLAYAIDPTDAPTAIPDPCATYSGWDATYLTNIIGIPLQVYDAASVCSSLLPNIQSNTDVLVVRHVETCVAGATGCEADTSGKLYFQSSNCESQISGGSSYVLGTTGFTMQTRACDGSTYTDKRKFNSHIYYVRDYATTVGDGIPTLMRSEFDLSGGTLAHQTATPLIEGIESFRVELGIDTHSKTNVELDSNSGTAVVDSYGSAVTWTDNANKDTPTNRGDGEADGEFIRCTTGTACSVADLTNVVAAKIYVLARTLETSSITDTKTYSMGNVDCNPPTDTNPCSYDPNPDDNYKRHVFITSVRLNNISGRRETP